jgi:hypothetical protein
MNWGRLFADMESYVLALPGRLSDWLTGTELRGHGAVDIAGPGEPMRLWCLPCNQPYPCARLTAMEQEARP